MQAKNASNIKVIDVSRYQGSIKWQTVKADGVRGAIIKATEGKTGIDLKFSANASGAFLAGVAIGYYHYARPEYNTPEDEASNFYRTVKGHPVDFPYVLDIEDDEDHTVSKLGKTFLTDWCVKWLQAVERLSGHPAMIYTGGSFARTYLGKALGKWPLWVAHYGVDKPMDNSTWKEWAAFQYSSSGKVNGIAGNVDINAMEAAFFNRNTEPAEKPAVDIVPKVVKDGKLVITGRLVDERMEAPLAAVLDAAGVKYSWDNDTKKLYLL